MPERPTWFITGASRGFGAAIARVALEQGANVVATSRSPASHNGTDRLLEVALDVTSERQAIEAAEAADARFGRIDVLVNNAGRGMISAVEEASNNEVRSLFDVNVFGLLNMTRAVLPTMREQGSGRIINMSSVAGLVGFAHFGLYNASKFAVEGLTEALKEEVLPFGIDVMAVAPGAFRTDFLDGSSMSVPARPHPAYAAAAAVRAWAADANHTQQGDPDKAAALIWDAVQEPVMPTHLAVGGDCVEAVENKLVLLSGEVAAWRDRSLATTH